LVLSWKEFPERANAPVTVSSHPQPFPFPTTPIAYRHRNLIERVVGWYKEYRALGTRYEKLAVNYVAVWIIAIIEKLLRKYAHRLQTGLSERA
jgi:hypothetical protein